MADKLESRFAGGLVEPQRASADDGMLGNPPRRVQVMLQGGFLHELGEARVGKPGAADRVAGEPMLQLKVQPCQIADAMSKLGAGQAAHHHVPGLPVALSGNFVDGGSHSRDDLPPLFATWLRRIAWRHEFLLHVPRRLSPSLEAPHQTVDGIEAMEVHPRLSVLIAMTIQAKSTNQRPRLLVERLG